MKQTPSICLLLGALLAIVGATASNAQNAVPKYKQVTREIPLGKIDRNIVPGSTLVSPDGQRFAYVVSRDKRAAVVLDGIPGKEYEFVVNGSLRFSPDSKQFVYAAGTKREMGLVKDGVESERKFDAIPSFAIEFSPDSKQIAYYAIEGKRLMLVRDGSETALEKTAPEDPSNSLRFQPGQSAPCIHRGAQGETRFGSGRPDWEDIRRGDRPHLQP